MTAWCRGSDHRERISHRRDKIEGLAGSVGRRCSPAKAVTVTVATTSDYIPLASGRTPLSSIRLETNNRDNRHVGLSARNASSSFSRVVARAAEPSTNEPESKIVEVVEAPELPDIDIHELSPEEDVEVPGGYFEAMNPQTKLGKAVRSACSELELLNSLEMDVLAQCDDLLKKLGVQGSIMVRDEPLLVEDEPIIVEDEPIMEEEETPVQPAK
eukprot:gene9917-7784_t